MQGDGGFGVGQFSATVPTPDGGRREIKGNLATVYQHGADGWHLRLVIASIRAPAAEVAAASGQMPSCYREILVGVILNKVTRRC